jgi:hypothetical protein
VTDEFIRETAPHAETLSEQYSGGKYLRTVQGPDGWRETIAYDYRTKAVTILTTMEETECKTNRNKYHETPRRVFDAAASCAIGGA